VQQSASNLLVSPNPSQSAEFSPEHKPRYWVTIDTEEDFDWNAPFSRTGYRLDSVPALAECQRYFEAALVSPIYLVDWPIVADDSAVAILGAAQEAGKCEIGAQLHPWVTPPFDEVVDARNSYTGNLPLSLQRAKLAALRDAIQHRFSLQPLLYRAGRYGLSADTANILADLGFRCDTSVRSLFDYRPGHGPDYRRLPLSPWWVGEGDRRILEAPLTTVFSGWLRTFGQDLYHLLAKPNSLAGAAMARLQLMERIALTPEGIPADKACRAVDIALDLRLPLLNFSFHSPSLQPGNTPYVRDQADLQAFYRWWDIVLDHLARRGVEATNSVDFLASIDNGPSDI
jgi:hypothetical protein